MKPKSFLLPCNRFTWHDMSPTKPSVGFESRLLTLASHVVGYLRRVYAKQRQQIKVLFFIVCLFQLVSIGICQEELPQDGRIYFHQYTSYDAWDSQIWMYDFPSRELKCLSERWSIDHAMNPRFSRDGKVMVFMAVEHEQRSGSDWDIYLWKVDSPTPPLNLTKNNGLRDEDPQLSVDGKTLLFKQAGRVHLMNLDNQRITQVIEQDQDLEQSMPIFTRDESTIVFMQGAGKTGDLFAWESSQRSASPVANEAGLQEYFPVPWDNDRFLYVRWVAPNNRNDQIYQYSWLTRESYRLPFCERDHNYSDPCPVNQHLVIFSSTRAGGRGGYDLYLGNSSTGKVVDLSLLGVNSAAEELGCVYVTMED